MDTHARLVRLLKHGLIHHRHQDVAVTAEGIANYLLINGVTLPPQPRSDLGRRAPLTDRKGRPIAQ